MNGLKKTACILLPLILLAFTAPDECLHAAAPKKNVIFMIMDGTNSDAVTLSRWYKGSPLHLDGILTGGVRTYSAESAITDSAAAGTAMATGVKTKADYIGMDPEGLPLITVLEAAKLNGYATGIISTSPVQHATPAAFTSHAITREEFSSIGEQQVYQDLDVVLGGGAAWLAPKQKNHPQDDAMLKTDEVTRKDGEDLKKSLRDAGYAYVDTRKELLLEPSAGKLWGAFASEDLSYDLDRRELKPHEPTLSEMTRSAISHLSREKKGFFLMVEGSKVDWAAHQNDPVGMISEILSFDRAVGEALAFAKKDGNTMVVAVTDHGNSGLTIGNADLDGSYKHQSVKHFIDPLKKARLTVDGAASLLEGKDAGHALAAYGLDSQSCRWSPSKKELKAQMTSSLSQKAGLGFTTHGHTGEDVFLYAFGPGKPSGLLENTDLPVKMADFLGFSLDSYRSWYVDGKTLLEKQGYDVTLKTGTANPEMMAKKGKTVLRFPENKNFYMSNDDKIPLKSVTVFNGKTFYIHMDSM
ncbi:alkaline phosphatase [Rossellomorea marisflavi]|uniref:alkaline phosphatase n=1 Tax=Rossellomorea marisflavi TaxID=189381 RepID=UPI0013189776|nr:alkaline phosphatase [Rossellomorea marisflavi]QHA37955.1 alkaline phosphatase [Rossellomorea marisflavi]